MHLFKKKKLISYPGIWLTLLIFGCVCVLFMYHLNGMPGSLEMQQRRSLKAAIERAVVTCYAIEGFYPPDLRYLKEHYGITFDEEKYAISYDAWGSNIKPNIQVMTIGGEQE